MSEQDFIESCKARGFFHQCTDEAALSELMNKESIPAYIGFDATASSLHVGSLLQIMLLRWLQKCGHKPIVLMGGGTTKVGDPSGKDESRKMLTEEKIAENMAGIKRVFETFLTFGDGPTDAIMVNNADWLDNLNYIEFLRDYGRYFSVNRMLTMESVKQRLGRESHLSFLEFNYMILQAYDFVELNQRYNCRLQIGGSDQWGNIIMGTDLFAKLLVANFFEQKGSERPNIEDLKEKDQNIINKRIGLFGLTSPLITTSSGAKMGKTANGAIWLDADLLSPYDYWQFWRNTEDADVGRFLRMFTELSIDEIEKLEALEGAAINDAKKVLANEATKMLHGEAAAKEAAETAQKTFEQGAIGDALPEFFVPEADLNEGIPAFKLFFDAGLESSGGKARKLITGGGAKVNDAKVEKEDQIISAADMVDGTIKLSAGKKRHALIKIAS
ncbi:MAG: tyrosine--tRNA ligase [Rickettsiales bacterium]|nr:tyrosine--tRNA ligase [Rickettsiales bacterium]